VSVTEQALAAEAAAISDAETAKQILASDFFVATLKYMEKTATKLMLAAKDDDGRRTAQAQAIAVLEFEKELDAALGRGQLATHNRTIREKAEAAAPRRAPTRK
jgi:hypothetical protein